MKILVNAVPLQNLPTGIGRYLASLYSEIERRYPEIAVRYFTGSGMAERLPCSPGKRSLWTAAAGIAWHLPAIVPYGARILMHETNQNRFLRISRGFDIYHEAGYFPLKAAQNVKTVFTVHDISLKTLPDFHPKDRVLFFNKYFERSLSRADAIITPSVFTRQELNRVYPGIRADIHPVSLGVDEKIFFRRTETEICALKSQLRLPEKYILFAGTADPRKNIQAIFTAIKKLPESVKLVCTGWSGWQKTGADPDLKNRVFYTGYVSDEDLAILYSGARAFVYPSFYEGFGLPLVEAMACGCPVICSNRSSLPEVVGDAAATCDPEDAQCLADAVSAVFYSDRRYAEMRRKSDVRGKKFTWAETAKQTIEVFHGCL